MKELLSIRNTNEGGFKRRSRVRLARQIEQELNPYFGTEIHIGEFDPGSERTLAARFKHASRAVSAAMYLERRTGE